MEVVVWWCFAGDADLFRIRATLNQHGYHSILQQYAISSGLRVVGLSFVFQQDNDPKTHLQAVYGLFDQGEWWSAASDDLVSTITQPQPRWFGMSWTEEWRKRSQQVLSITPSRLLLTHSRWSWWRECQECAKLSSRQRVATLKNLKYKTHS